MKTAKQNPPNQRTPFLTDPTGELFVELAYSGISAFVVACDGIPITFFGDGKTAYLTVQQAIAWHEKEIRDTNGQGGDAEIMEALRDALKKFEAGKIADA